MSGTGRPRRRLGALIGTAVAAAASVTVALVVVGAGVSQGAPTLVKIDPAGQGTPIPVDARSPALSDDGTFAVFIATAADGSAKAFVRDIAQQTTTPVPAVTGVVREAGTAISADGCRIAFWGSTDAGGPTPSTTTPPSVPAAGAVTLYLWNRCAAQQAPVELPVVTSLGLTGAATVARPALSRDGAVVAYAARPGAAGPWHVAVVDVAGQRETAVTPDPVATTTVDVSADGQTLAYDAGTDPAGPPTGVFLAAAGQAPVAVPSPAGSSVAGMPSLSAGGSIVAFVANSSGTLRPYVYSSVSGATSPAVDSASPGQVVQPAITPDGSQVAYTVAAGTTGTTGLAIAPGAPSAVVVARSTSGAFATSALEPLSTAPVPVGTTSASPAISATGQLAVFATSNGAGSDVWSAQRQPALTVTPAFDLGTVAVGSSSQPAAVTFTNPSSVGIALGPVAPLGAPFAVTADTCSNFLVPPAGTCTVTVVFSPTDSVTSNASLTVGGQGVNATASLSGTGRSLVRSIALSPSTVSLPTTAVGARGGPGTATVTNSGEVPVAIDSVTLGGSDGGQFVITGNGCGGAMLAPDETCAVEVTAIPARAGSLRATLTVDGTEGESASTTVAVTATTVTPTTRPPTPTTRPPTPTTTPPGRLTASPGTVSFSATPIGTTSDPVPVTITNAGSSSVSGLSVQLLGDGQFTVADDGCTGDSLSAGRSCTVSLTVTPAAGGSTIATLTVTGSRGESVAVAVSAAAAEPPTVRVNPGVVRAGGSTTVTGAGFSPGASVVVQLVAPNGTGSAVPVGSTTADDVGGFRLLVQVPGSIGQGGWRVQGVAGAGTSAAVALLIETVSPSPGSPGGGPVVGGVPRPL